ncbi:transcription factor S-II, central domain-containing protein [Melampsora americana]|nr:transcription factor S-II, central domain-containing protein [Melampsora americana]
MNETPDREELINNDESQPGVNVIPGLSDSTTSIPSPKLQEAQFDPLVLDPLLAGIPLETSPPKKVSQDPLMTTPAPASSKTSRKKHRRAEGLTSEEDDTDEDEDFTGEETKRPKSKKRKTPSGSQQRRSSNLRLKSITPYSTAPHTPKSASPPVTGLDKTRAACIQQFSKLFETAFSDKLKDQDEDTENQKKEIEAEATRFAESMESELFDSFGEVDAKNVKAPRKQYMSKFRSLFFNLKHNPVFLGSLRTTEISPRSIVHMSNQELQTPEQKAISDQIRQRALHDSVRNVISAPKAKMTHKGEQTIETFDPMESQQAEPSGSYSGSFVMSTHHQSGGIEQHDVLESPSRTTSQLGASQSAPHSLSASTNSTAVQYQRDNADQPDFPASILAFVNPSSNSHAPERTNSLNGTSSFDLERVLAAMTSVPPSHMEKLPSTDPEAGIKRGEDGQTDDKDPSEEDNMDLAATPEHDSESKRLEETREGQLPDDYDPFAIEHGGDADLDAILHGDPSTTPPHSPINPPPSFVVEVSEPVRAASAPIAPTVDTPPPVWKGNVMTADAGGFAACATQVGGRPLCTNPSTWERLFPTDTLTVVGRLPVKDSTSYLVQSHFAASRELIVLNLTPNLDGPPDLPPPERVMQHQQNLIDFFTKKGRHAVVAVHDRAKHVVRDIYLVPLLKQEPLPEFVELLDDQNIEESNPRSRDMILAVLVLQKGTIPTGWRPPTTSISESQTATAQVQVSQMPFAPQGPSAALPLPPTTSDPQVQSAQLSRLNTALPYPPPQGNFAALPPNLASIPLLQSLSSALSTNQQIPFNLFPQTTPSLASTQSASNAAGPPPGFVPYRPPTSATSVQTTSSVLPSSVPPSGNLGDLLNVDVNTLKALLSNPQVFPNPPDAVPQPILTLAQSNNAMSGSQYPHPSNSYSGISQASMGAASTVALGPNPYSQAPMTRPPGLPPIPQMSPQWTSNRRASGRDPRDWNQRGPRMSDPTLDPFHDRSRDDNRASKVTHLERARLQRMAQMQESAWDPAMNQPNGRSPSREPSEPAHRRSLGGSIPGKRSGPHEFVAPVRDAGWAGRGGGRSGSNVNRSVSGPQQRGNNNNFSNDQNDQELENQYSAPIWMGR